MPLIDTDYFNQQMVTLGLKESFTPKAETLSTLIAEASEWIEAECSRKFGQQEVIEDLRGKGYNRLILGQYPVSALNSITYYGEGEGTGTVDKTLVRVLDRSGMLEWKEPHNGPWLKSRLYTVNYGLPSPVPGPVKRATALKVVDLLAPQYQGPRERKIELVSNVQEQIILLIEPYRRERLG